MTACPVTDGRRLFTGAGASYGVDSLDSRGVPRLITIVYVAAARPWLLAASEDSTDEGETATLLYTVLCANAFVLLAALATQPTEATVAHFEEIRLLRTSPIRSDDATPPDSAPRARDVTSKAKGMRIIADDDERSLREQLTLRLQHVPPRAIGQLVLVGVPPARPPVAHAAASTGTPLAPAPVDASHPSVAAAPSDPCHVRPLLLRQLFAVSISFGCLHGQLPARYEYEDWPVRQCPTTTEPYDATTCAGVDFAAGDKFSISLPTVKLAWQNLYVSATVYNRDYMENGIVADQNLIAHVSARRVVPEEEEVQWVVPMRAWPLTCKQGVPACDEQGVMLRSGLPYSQSAPAPARAVSAPSTAASSARCAHHGRTAAQPASPAGRPRPSLSPPGLPSPPRALRSRARKRLARRCPGAQ